MAVELAVVEAIQWHYLTGALSALAITVPMMFAVSDVPAFGILLVVIGAVAYAPTQRADADFSIVIAVWVGSVTIVAVLDQLLRSRHQARLSFVNTMIEWASEAITTISVTGVVLSWNPAAERLYGYSVSEIIGQSFDPLVPPEEREVYDGLCVHVFAGRSHCMLVQRITKDGRRLWVETTTSPVYMDGSVVAMSSIARDVTAERKLQQEIHFVMDERDRIESARRDLANRLLSAEEQERQRVAAELHDDTIQVMAGLLYQLEGVKMGISNESPGEVATELDVAVRTLRECLTRTRHLMFELHPAVLENQGLEPAVREIAAAAGKAMDATAVVEVTTGRFDPILEALVFRVVRECVHNVRKHSRADEFTVIVRREGDRVLGQIEDNGVGFDLSGLISESHGIYKHLGLSSLVERVHLAGGQAHIRTSQGAGCSVAFMIPVPSANGHARSHLAQASHS